MNRKFSGLVWDHGGWRCGKPGHPSSDNRIPTTRKQQTDRRKVNQNSKSLGELIVWCKYRQNLAKYFLATVKFQTWTPHESKAIHLTKQSTIIVFIVLCGGVEIIDATRKKLCSWLHELSFFRSVWCSYDSSYICMAYQGQHRVSWPGHVWSCVSKQSGTYNSFKLRNTYFPRITPCSSVRSPAQKVLPSCAVCAILDGDFSPAGDHETGGYGCQLTFFYRRIWLSLF